MKKRILVTGANSGMGKALSLRLAREGHQVIMLCRDRGRGQEALDELRRESGNDALRLLLCDLASLASIGQAAREFLSEYDSLDVLINNAGVILPRRRETSDGFELQFGVNHLGHFALSLSLMPAILKGAEPRIVIVSSGAHALGDIHFDDIGLKRNFNLVKAYSRSKLANLLFCRELAQRLSDSGVSVNCLHPGAVGTSMGIDRDTGFGKLAMALLRPFFKTPDQGADTAYYLAVSDEVRGRSGGYYVNRRIRSPSARARDPELARRLWELSESMTGIGWLGPEALRARD